MGRIVSASCSLLLICLASARIQHLDIKNDPRYAFLIETFGFVDGGSIDLDIRGVSVTPAGDHTMGFVLVPVETEDEANEFVDRRVLNRDCPLSMDELPEGSLPINISDPSTWKDLAEPADVSGNSDFALVFMHCAPVGSGVTVSFSLDAIFVNYQGGQPNYLSAGEMALPTLYGVFGVIYAGLLVVWALYLRRHRAERAKIHLGMSLLLGMKTLSLVTEAIMYHYIAVTGHNTVWNAMFYFFSAIKGFLMVVVSMLVASGWSIMRPFLSEREKKVLMIALAMQLLANTALMMTDELAPGSMQYSAWVWLMHIADMCAAAAVIVPVTWSMKSLEQSAIAAREGDGEGKAAETLDRLGKFRNFYLYTISYLYVTRFFVALLGSRVGYNQGWMPPCLEEVCTLAYMVYSGYRFRPASENSYLRVSGEDDENTPGDIEMGRATGAGVASTSGPVQTVAAVHRSAYTAAAVEDELAANAAAPAAAPAAAKTRHVIADEDDEFGLDEELDGLEASVGAGAGAPARPSPARPAPQAAAPAPSAPAADKDGEGWDDNASFEDDLDEDEKRDLIPANTQSSASKPALKKLNKEKD